MNKLFYLLFPIILNTNITTTEFSLDDCNALAIGLNNINIQKEQVNLITETQQDTDALATQLYLILPQNIRTYLENTGWCYQLVSKSKLENICGQKNVIGYTDINNKIVYVANDELSINRALLHEYGHVVGSLITKEMIIDLYEKGVSEEYLNFNNLYIEEKDTFAYSYKSNDGHEISNMAEYLASTFHEYITNPYNLNDKCPKTFMFWQYIINTF